MFYNILKLAEVPGVHHEIFYNKILKKTSDIKKSILKRFRFKKNLFLPSFTPEKLK